MALLTYLGPEGTFTSRAARDLARPGDRLETRATVPEVVQAVENGDADGGVVAFENSLEGSVAPNLDELLLLTDRCLIAGERVLPVTFTLWRALGDEAPLRGVASHPFGLAQCSRFISEQGAQTRESASTAAACAELAQGFEPGWGALAPPHAGELYGLRAERERLENDTRAATRFVLLRRSCPAPTGNDRSAFSFRPSHDEPGSLVRLLQQFSLREINMTTLKSRPTKESLGEYVFYVECDGHICDDGVRDAVLGVLRYGTHTRFLGSFPADSGQPPAPAPVRTASLGAYDEMRARVES